MNPKSHVQLFLKLAVRSVLGSAWFALVGCAGTQMPSAAIQHNHLGALFLSKGDIDAAEANFRLALEYERGFPEPHSNLALVALERGDPEAAEEHAYAALELDPNLAQAWLALGVSKLRRRDLQGAEEAFVSALRIEPGMKEARLNLAVLHARRGEFGECRAQMSRLVQLVSESADLTAILAYCELGAGQYSAAWRWATRARVLDPSNELAVRVLQLIETPSRGAENRSSSSNRIANPI